MSQTLIIITGGQGTGKTHLAKHLSETKGANVIDCGLNIEQVRLMLRNYIDGRQSVIVIQKVQLLDLLKFIDRDTFTRVVYSIIDLDIVSYETV